MGSWPTTQDFAHDLDQRLDQRLDRSTGDDESANNA